MISVSFFGIKVTLDKVKVRYAEDQIAVASPRGHPG
jgi:hypothetical protein